MTERKQELGTCRKCGHEKNAHFESAIGCFCKKCPVATPDHSWEHVFEPLASPEEQGRCPRCGSNDRKVPIFDCLMQGADDWHIARVTDEPTN